MKLVESRENLFHLLTQICSSDKEYGEDSDILEPFQLQPYSMNNCLVTERMLTVNSMEVFLKLLQDSVYRTLVANHWNNTLSILVTPPNPAPLDHQIKKHSRQERFPESASLLSTKLKNALFWADIGENRHFSTECSSLIYGPIWLNKSSNQSS